MRCTRICSFALLAIATGATAVPVQRPDTDLDYSWLAPFMEEVSVHEALHTIEAHVLLCPLQQPLPQQDRPDVAETGLSLQRRATTWKDLDVWGRMGWVALKMAPKLAGTYLTMCLVLPKCIAAFYRWVAKPIGSRIWKAAVERREIDDGIEGEDRVQRLLDAYGVEHVRKRSEETGREVVYLLDAHQV